MGIITLQSSTTISGYTHISDVRISGNYAYLIGHTSTKIDLLVYNIGTPASPSLVSTTNLKTFPISCTSYANAFISGSYLYVATRTDPYVFATNSYIIDISNPLSPSVSSGSMIGGKYILVYSNYAFIVHYSDTSHVYTYYIANKSAPVYWAAGRLGTGINTPTSLMVDTFYELLYVNSSGDNKLTLYSISGISYSGTPPVYDQTFVTSINSSSDIVLSYFDNYTLAIDGTNSNVGVYQENHLPPQLGIVTGGGATFGSGYKIRRMSGNKIVCAGSEGIQIFDDLLGVSPYLTFNSVYGGYTSGNHSVDTSGSYIFFIGQESSKGFLDVLLYDEESSSSISISGSYSSNSSSSTNPSTSSTSSAETSSISGTSEGFFVDRISYYNDFQNYYSINNPLVGDEVKMKYMGFFDVNWDKDSIDFTNYGYGLKKMLSNQGYIYCDDASKLFTMGSGYISLTINFPYSFINGVYGLIESNSNLLNEYILWGVNIGQYEPCQPGFYVALTKNGLEFTINTSAGKQTIIDTSLNADANTDIKFDFMWNKHGINSEYERVYIRINNVFTSVANTPIYDNSLKNIKFSVLDTPFSYSDLECTIKNMLIAPLPIEISEIQSSSSTSASSSSSTSYIKNWSSSSSSSTSSSSTSKSSSSS